jgi:hypothetical protein
MMQSRALVLAVLLAIGTLGGCASPASEVDHVARDWCLAIRASQVLPVYPLTEDIVPGDVFLVQTPLSRQTEIYRERGFLALDQHVTRLGDLPYDEYYGVGYFEAAYVPPPGGHDRPGAADLVRAPRAAFPTYNFSVERGGELQLAIPIQGVPVGLDIMGATRATGSVSLGDANTYGIDGASAYEALMDWWRSDPRIGETLGAITEQMDAEVFLRVITRVYLVRSVTVSLTNLDNAAAGVDVAPAPSMSQEPIAAPNAQQFRSSAQAYADGLELLSRSLNERSGRPGGAVRFVQASGRSVTLDETFDRPLAIGYLAFDVKVFDADHLSPPVPSFSVLSADAPPTFVSRRADGPEAGDD